MDLGPIGGLAFLLVLTVTLGSPMMAIPIVATSFFHWLKRKQSYSLFHFYLANYFATYFFVILFTAVYFSDSKIVSNRLPFWLIWAVEFIVSIIITSLIQRAIIKQEMVVAS